MARRFSTVVTVARWILFLPVGVGVFFAAFAGSLWLMDYVDLTKELAATFGGALGAALAVWIGSLMAPSGRRAVALVLAVPI